MSAESVANYPTFVDINTGHRSGLAASDQTRMNHNQSGIEPHQANINQDINNHHGEASIPISNFHDQASIDVDSQSHQTQNAANNIQSPTENDSEIYEVGDPGNSDDANHVWVKEEVELMFKLYKERQKEFNDPQRKKRDIFTDICTHLRRHGYYPTPKQCDRKLRNMKATYIRTLERIKRGDALATCQYYDDLYDIYGLTPPLQTPSRFVGQSRNRPLPIVKDGFSNETGNHGRESYEPAIKKFALEIGDEKDSPIQRAKPEGNSLPFLAPLQPEGTAGHQFQMRVQTDNKALNDLVEEIRVLRKSLEDERASREEERKSFAEERKEFHKERMSMLNSINKLIGNIDVKNG